jgi:hypothetical protein
MEKKIPSKIVATIDATHSGIVNGNYFMYLPDGLRGGKDSFVKPYNKPITDGHPKFYENEKETPVLGRVISAEYESYGLNDAMDSMGTRAENIVDAVQQTYKMQLADKEYKGLGSMKIKAEITDPEAIKQIMDKRKMTVSIGAYLDNARCSVCGSKWGDCEHEIANSYNGLVAFRVGGNMKFDHVAFVKTPADENAMVSNIEISDSGDKNFNIMVYDEVQIVKIENPADLKLEIMAKFNDALNLVDGKIIDPEAKATYDAASQKGRQHSYLFQDTKDIYLKDRLGLLAAKVAVIKMEETESNKQELDSIKGVIDTLIESGRFFEKQSEDNLYLDMLESMFIDKKIEEQEQEKEISEVLTKLDEQTIDSIADAVYNKIKQEGIKTDNYSKDRLKTLELALIELEDKLNSSEQELLAFARKFDKDVQDADSARNFFIKMEDVTQEEEKELEKINVGDNIIQEEELAEDETKSISAEDAFCIDNVGDTYREILKEQGFMQAKAYLKNLRDNNKIPSNFIL